MHLVHYRYNKVQESWKPILVTKHKIPSISAKTIRPVILPLGHTTVRIRDHWQVFIFASITTKSSSSTQNHPRFIPETSFGEYLFLCSTKAKFLCHCLCIYFKLPKFDVKTDNVRLHSAASIQALSVSNIPLVVFFISTRLLFLSQPISKPFLPILHDERIKSRVKTVTLQHCSFSCSASESLNSLQCTS